MIIASYHTMKVIIVTGTPGTGKTTLSKKLAKELNFSYLDVNETIKKYKLSEGYDKDRDSKIVDVKKLDNTLIKEINNFKNTIKKNSIKMVSPAKFNKIRYNKINSIKNKKNDKTTKNGIVIDSHLSHYLPKKYVNLCIITKCGLKELERRLKKKNYSKQKIRENLDAEIFDVCLNEAKENKHNVIIIDTTKGINMGKISKKAGGLIGI